MSGTLLRGSGIADAFIFDVPVLGEQRCRARVLALWESGADLRALPDGRWLMAFPTQRPVRAEHALGLPLRREGERYIERRHGTDITHTAAALERINPSAWLDTDTFQVVDLTTLDAPPAPVLLDTASAPIPPPDIRTLARVGKTSRTSLRLLDEATGTAGGSGAQSRSGPSLRSWLASLTLRTPASGIIARRHTQYLERLTMAFNRRDFDTALREAVPLGGTGGWLTLRLPRPRQGRITPATTTTRPGGAVPWGSSAQATLAQLYRQAAARLELEGDIERAAFVHADLLRSPVDAVTLLERHGLLDLAARLAETHHLPAPTIVRLWWRAGNRQRAVTAARARGAWREAITALEGVDGAAAAALRAEWVAALRTAHDHVGAIEASWPDPDLRALIGPDLATLDAIGGSIGIHALALRLRWWPSPPQVDAALALLADRSPDDVSQRRMLARLIAERTIPEPGAERRLATEALRTLLRDADATGENHRTVTDQLGRRADPLVTADLPRPRTRRSPAVPIAFADPIGGVPIGDAVPVPGGFLLALGAHGLALARPDGRVISRWDTTAMSLVAADHGATMLAVAHGEGLEHVSRLDVATRRLSRIPTIPERIVARTFDGSTVITINDTRDRLHGIDLTGPAPLVLWEELEHDHRPLLIERAHDALSALIDLPVALSDQRCLEIWTWDLPSRALRRRRITETRPDTITADGTAHWVEQDLAREPREWRQGHDDRSPILVASGEARIGSTGSHTIRVTEDDETRVLIRDANCAPIAVSAFPLGSDVAGRVLGDSATIWTRAGHLIAWELSTRRLLANMRVHL